MKKRVYYDSTDAGGIVYHTEYIKFCEQARSDIFFKHNVFFENDEFVVTELNAKFISSAKLGDLLEIKTKVIEIRNIKVLIEQKILKENKTIFILNATLAYMKNYKLSKIPQKYKDILNEYT